MSSEDNIVKGGRSEIEKMSEIRIFSDQECASMKLINGSQEGSRHLQVFRDLRTQLLKQTKKRAFSCLVTSVSSGGGSYVAANLAATICLDKSKSVLFVDANLYSPFSEKLLPVPARTGLTDFLDDPSLGIEDIVYASGVKRLRVVPVGNNREGGTEKLHSSRMKSLLTEISERYDDRSIIIDAPPVDDYEAEVSILADLCDLVVLVVPYGRVTEASLRSAISTIGKERLAGVVFNSC